MKKNFLFSDILHLILFFSAMFLLGFAIIFLIIFIRGTIYNYNEDFNKWVWSMALFLLATIGAGVLAGILKIIHLFESQNEWLQQVDEIDSIGGKE